MTRIMHVATVQLLIPCEHQTEASDFVSESLRETFPDWAYLQIGGQVLSPTERIVNDAAEYEEGEAFDI
jgi:hypothetical protein